jgi:two-component system, LuxR family, sensor kinase FixL
MPRPKPPAARSRWRTAHKRVERPEHSAGRMSKSRFFGNAAIYFAASLLLVTALALGLCLIKMQQDTDREQRVQDDILHTIALQDALDEMAVATRFYAAGRDPQLLAEREKSKQEVRARLDSLTASVDGDPVAVGQLGNVRRAVVGRVQRFDEMVAFLRLPDAAKRLQASELDRIRSARQVGATLVAFRSHAHDLLETLEQQLARNTRLAILLALFAGLAAPLCGLVGFHLLRRERDSQSARELQLELMHVQRLAMMGETSAMLAHEINQPLTAANNYLSVLRRHLAAGSPDKAETMAERIAQQIQRAAGIVRKLRRFIEKREAERSLQSPEALIEDAITLLGTIDGSIHLKTEIGSHLPHVLVDRVQIQQVLVNLMRNAIEAMQDSPSRALSLSAFARDGNMVEIALADSGPGLSAEVAGRLFEPFVSTKEKGMGVGLSICRSIIAQHGGQIWAEANPAGGTIFRFTLPAAEERDGA